jgi:hypothetical protein
VSYAVYRANDAGFTPSAANRLGYTTMPEWTDPNSDMSAWYRVTAIDRHGNESASSLLGVQQIAGVSLSAAPAISYLGSARPNPARSACALELGISRSGPVRVEIVDTAGRRVRTLFAGTATAGIRTITWKGTDDDGRPMADGIYWVRFTAPDRSMTRRIALAR